MAKKPFISVDGITVGEASALVNVIAANGDITTSNITISNNANLGNVGNIIITGGTNGYVLSTNGSGALSWVAQSGGGGGASISNGNSNVNIPTANGNVNISAVGNANILVVTGTGANITGTANITGNLTAGNFIAGTGSGGNLSGANVISANTFTATGNITAGNANLGNATTANYFIGNFYGTANSATTAGTVTTAAQPNITSVGTLSGLTSTGTINLTGASNVALGPVANVHITGGSNGQYLQTDGSGTLTWSTVSSGSTSNISNGNSNVNIPAANGNVNISAVGNANVLIVTGTGVNVAGTANFTGNLTAGNFIAGSGSGGNLSGANVISANIVNASISANLGNSVTANFFVGNGSLLTGIVASFPISNGNSNISAPSANGNINISVGGTSNVVVTTSTGVNIAGTFNATGNVTANNIIAGAGTGGNITGANLVSANYFTGTLTTAAQPNITSVGTLSSLTVSGTANITANANIGGNLNLTGAGKFILATLDGNETNRLTFKSANANQYSILQIAPSSTTDSFAGWAAWSKSDTSNGTYGFYSVNSNGAYIETGNTGTGSAPTKIAFTVAGNTSFNVLTTGANVTGTLNVTSNITSGNANLGNAVTANFFIGSGANLTSIPAGNISGQVANALVAGTVYTNAQPNITSVGTLTSINVTGNIVSNANVVTDLIVGRTSGITITATGTNQNINLTPTGTGTVNVGNFIISNVLTPVASTDAATKQYVDDVAQGLNIHDSVAAATPTTLATITSGTITYNNGSSGVGANLTTTGTFNLIDGVNVQTSGTRILVKNEANAVHNGIYTWSNATVITRATDYNSVPEVEAGDFVFVTGGTLYDNTGWVQTSTVSAIGTVGNNIEFTQFSGAGTYTAGTGLTLTGSVFSISNTTVTSGSYGNGDTVATFTVNGQGQLTAAANTVIAANAANLTGTTLATGIVTSSLTSVGTLTGLTSNGIVNFANTSNVTLGAVANLHISGGTNAYVLSTDGAGTLSWVAQSAGAGVSNISNGNSNVNIPSANGNVTVSVAGTANVVNVTGSNVFVTANIIPTANITYDLGTSTNRFRDLYLSGNTIKLGDSNISSNSTTVTILNGSGGQLIIGGNSTVNTADLSTNSIANGNSNVVVTANGNVSTSVAGTANVLVVTGTGANINGTANITGNVALSGANVSLGTVSNLHITGGSNGYVLTTDGTGNLSWASQTGSNIVIDTFTGNGVQTVFTLTDSPASEDYTIINIDGVSQLHSAYTVANANVTLSSAPASGAVIEVMTFNLGGAASGGNGSSGYTYVEATGNTNAAANTKYIVNTNTANLTITLPSTPSFGDEVGIIDGTGNASVHAITVARNGGNIQGAASNMTVTTDRSAFTLVYYNASQGWVLTNV